jgi:hypothetical protein
MSKVRDRIQSIVNVEQGKRPNCEMGIVQRCYPDSFECDIMTITNDLSTKRTFHARVPLPMVGGMSYCLPHIGDRVLVEYLGGDMNAPYVVSIYPANDNQAQSLSQIAKSQLQHFSTIE